MAALGRKYSMKDSVQRLSIMKVSPVMVAIGILSAMLLIGSHGNSASAADDTVCDGVLSAGTFKNVVVLAGTSCTLSGAVVVEGNVIANDAVDVVVQGTSTTPIPIGGNVHIED